MVHNCFVRCQVCGCITRVRLQVGHLPEHPIIFACGNCKTSLSGSVIIDQDNPGLYYQFENADLIDGTDATHLVECSGEFPVKKQKENATILEDVITPYIRYCERVKTDDSFEDFFKVAASLFGLKKEWPRLKRIFDLYINDKEEYLTKELRYYFDESQMPCRDQIELLRAVHMLEIRFFISPLRKDILSNVEFNTSIMKLPFNQINQLIGFLNETKGLSIKELSAKVYKAYDEFINVFPSLIPALSISFLKEGTVDYNNEGSTTSDFDSVKQFYLDLYETIGDLLVIPAALDNISSRKDMNSFLPLEPYTVPSLKKFSSSVKATRFGYCDNEELYSERLKLHVDPKIRNAIGHNDYHYDTLSQELVYYPDPRNKSKTRSIFLLEYEEQILNMFQGLLMLSEYLYQLRKMEVLDEVIKQSDN